MKFIPLNCTLTFNVLSIYHSRSTHTGVNNSQLVSIAIKMLNSANQKAAHILLNMVRILLIYRWNGAKSSWCNGTPGTAVELVSTRRFT